MQFCLLTVNPRNANCLKDGHEEKTHAAGCVVIKELKDIHAPLNRYKPKRYNHTNIAYSYSFRQFFILLAPYDVTERRYP